MAALPNLLKETLITFGEGETRLPSAPSRQSLGRWSQDGIRIIAGKNKHGEDITGIAKLETVIVGARTYTSIEAFERFIKMLNP